MIELIAPTLPRVAAAVELARKHLSRWQGAEESNWQPGLRSTAPYSVHPSLLTSVVELSAGRSASVAMHLAESAEELELLRRGTGPLRAFVGGSRAWDAGAIPGGTRPLDYLRLLAKAGRAW